MLYLDLFEKAYIERTPTTGVVVPSDIPYLRRLYNFNRDNIETYYLNRTFSTKNTHILSRYIEHVAPFLNYDLFRYIDYADSKTEYLSKHFKFTSDIEKGIVHPPFFFGNNGEEIVFSNYDPDNIKDVQKNWKTASCVTVLKHPRNDTKLLLPLGNDNGSRGGLGVLVIDPVRLAVKYREFVREQLANEQTGGVVLNKNHFLMRHVLNTMLEETIDHMLLNKVMDRFYGREEVTPKFKHRFKIFEPTRQLDRYVDQTLDTITTKKIDFINILHNIQLIFKIDASELLALPEFSGTRQSKWALIISRLEHMCFLYDVAKEKGMSKHIINDWKRAVERLERDNVLKDQFSFTTTVQLKEMIEKIKSM